MTINTQRGRAVALLVAIGLSVAPAASAETANDDEDLIPTAVMLSAPAAAGATITVTATISPATASGTVDLSAYDAAGEEYPLDEATLAAGTATAQLDLEDLDSGVYLFEAYYSGDDTHDESTSPRVRVVVTQPVIIDRPELSAKSRPYGAKTVDVFTSLTGPASSVTFYAGTTALGTAQVDDGEAALTIPADLPVGTHAITAVAGTVRSAPVTFTVRKAALKKKPTVKVARLAKDKRRATITLGKLNNNAYPMGNVRITVNGKTAKTVKLTVANKGKIVVALPGKFPKTIKVKATYVGTATTTSATTRVMTVAGR